MPENHPNFILLSSLPPTSVLANTNPDIVAGFTAEQLADNPNLTAQELEDTFAEAMRVFEIFMARP